MQCIKCGKPATKRYSPDLDVKGIGMCDEHEEEVRMDLLVASFEGWDKFEKKYLKKRKMKAILSKEGGGYDLYRIDEDGKRVTFASTQDYKQKLSLKNCQAIECGYDLDELAYEFSWNYQSDPNYGDTIHVFKAGFQKALELMGDKKFSSGQLLNAMDLVWQWVNGEDYGCKTLTEVQDKHIQSLQQTEWDVEVEKENVMHDYNGNISLGAKFKLDADGCLILKKI